MVDSDLVIMEALTSATVLDSSSIVRIAQGLEALSGAQPQAYTDLVNIIKDMARLAVKFQKELSANITFVGELNNASLKKEYTFTYNSLLATLHRFDEGVYFPIMDVVSEIQEEGDDEA